VSCSTAPASPTADPGLGPAQPDPGLPSYSPDLNPIEPAWAQVKAELRRTAARDGDALHRALGPALDRVSAENARAYFRHCGYDRPD
jgi:DDE superfamily endonuclease